MALLPRQPALNPLKKLASQTVIYGLSSIVGRLLNYLLVPLYTRIFSETAYGQVSELYAYSGFLMVALTFGMETAFFRFVQKKEVSHKVFPTAMAFLGLAAGLFFSLILIFAGRVSAALHYNGLQEYIICLAAIISLDVVSALPLARLRQQNRAGRFAVVRLADIAVNIGLNLLFYLYLNKTEVWWLFVANLAGSLTRAACLLPQSFFRLRDADAALLKQMLRYSLPMVVIGFAGVINEMLDRVVLKYLLPGNIEENLAQVGIYSACYKLSILMTLFIQAYRYAAEPFFFNEAGNENAKDLYASSLRYFTVFGMFIFLLVMLFLDYFKLFIGENFRSGLHIVPVLLLANLFLGMHVNLSVWYKLSDKTHYGMWIALAGAVITLVLNVIFVPRFGYTASAWATLACYSMMALYSYCWGQSVYPVSYRPLRVLAHVCIGLAIWAANVLMREQLNYLHPFAAGFVCMLLFALWVWQTEFVRWKKS